VVAGESTADIAAALAARVNLLNSQAGLAEALALLINTPINDTTPSTYVATFTGLDLTIAKRGGGLITARLANATNSYSNAVTTAAASVTLTVGGAFNLGEVWTVAITDAANATTSFSAQPRHAALAEERTLVIIDRFTPFNTTPTFTIGSGSPLAFASDQRFASTGTDLRTAAATTSLAGIAATGTTYTLLLRIADLATPFTYTTVTGDTAASVIAALAAAVNVNGPDDFSALADGATLILVNRAGASFSLANTGNGSVAGKSAVVSLDAATLFAGEVWTVILDDAAFTTTHSHVVAAGETLTDPPEDHSRQRRA